MRSTHTRAAVLAHARGPITVESLHFAEPAAGEVLLRMEACGLCHSDLFVAGLEKLPLAPLTLGHEGIGTRGGGRARRRPAGRPATARASPSWAPPAEPASGAPPAASASVPSKPTSATRCRARSATTRWLPPPPWCAFPPIFPPSMRRPSAAPAGPRTGRSAKPPSLPANPWPSSATAASATWRSRSRSTRDCAPRFPIPRRKR